LYASSDGVNTLIYRELRPLKALRGMMKIAIVNTVSGQEGARQW
jgi:hypothetical protein